MKHRFPALTLAIVAIAVFALAGCMVSFGPPRIVSETVGAPESGSLSVLNNVGSITVEGAGRPDVAVTMTVAQQVPGFIPGTLTPPESVALQLDTSGGLSVSHSPFETRGLSVSYDIAIPTDLEVGRLATETGSITVRGVAGSPVLETTTGSITATDVAGAIHAESSTGSLTVRGSAAIVSLTTETGSVTAEVWGLEGSVVPVQTATGSIRLYVDPTLAATIHADTGTGSLFVDDDLDLAIDSFSGGGLVGTLNGGGPELWIETGTGSISLYSLD